MPFSKVMGLLLGVLGSGRNAELDVTCPTITPALSVELLANGNMETGSPPSSWGAFSGAVLSSQADERTGGAGSKSLGIARNGNQFPYAGQAEAVTVNQWLYMTAWQKNIDAAGGLRTMFQDGSVFPVMCGSAYQTAADWTQVHGTGRVTQNATGVARLYIDASVDAQSARFDDVSMKTITFSSMLSLIGNRSAVIGHYECRPTVTAGTHAGLIVRYLDANNFLIALIDRSAARASLWKVINGVWTAVVAPTTITFTPAAPLRVTISGSGTTHSLYYYDVQVGTDQTISDTLGYAVYGFSAYAGNEVGQVTTRPFEYTFFAVGDSRTPATGYQSYLTQRMTAATGRSWTERPNRFATAGFTVAAMLTYAQANIASVATERPPNFITVSLGANDVKALPTEAALKADYLALLDLFHTTFPYAKIVVDRIWRGTLTTEEAINTFDGWVDDIIAARDFVYEGLDERIYLENGDGGATYTLDGTHHNPAGYDLKAELLTTLLIALGY